MISESGHEGSGSLLWGKLSVLWVGTPGTVFPVERVGHRNANRGEAGLLPIQSSRNGTGSTRSLSKSEHRRSTPSRWKTVGPDRGAKAEWRPQQPTGEPGSEAFFAIGTAKLGLGRVTLPNRRRLIAAQERLRC